MRNLYLFLIVGVILSSGCTSNDNEASNQVANQADGVVQQPQQPACDQDFVGAWWLMGNEVYFIVESDCSVSKFCDLINDIHTTGSISENKIILAGGAINNEIVMSDSNNLTMLGGPDGIDLPFTRIYREYGIDPIPEDC